MEISDVEKAVITRILKEEMGVSITSLELEALISIGERKRGWKDLSVPTWRR